MEENLNPSLSPIEDEAALKWACDTLSFERDGHAINNKKTRRVSLAAFFNQFKANDFHAADGTAAAVELIHGKAANLTPAYLRGQQSKQLRQLDALVRWFASQLGVQDHHKLLTSLSHQLSQFNTDSCPAKVKSYGAKIWMAAKSVAPPTGEENVAAKKTLQALFHIATIRSTQRHSVRRQHVVRLKKEFSEDQLTEARNRIWQHHDTPNEIYHRPFLRLLTCDEDSVDSYQLPPPVASNTVALPYAESYRKAATIEPKKEASNNKLFLLIVVCSLVGLVVRISTSLNDGKPARTKPAWSAGSVNQPKFKFDPSLDPNDPRSVESALKIARTLQGKDTKLPTPEEFKGSKERAEKAKQRIKEHQAFLARRAGDPSESRKFTDEMVQRVEKQRLEHEREREQNRAEWRQQSRDKATKAVAEFLRKKEARKKKELAESGQQDTESDQRAKRREQQKPDSRTSDPFKMVQKIQRQMLDRQQQHIDRDQQFLDQNRERDAQMRRINPHQSKSLLDMRQRSYDLQQDAIDNRQKRLDEDLKSLGILSPP